MKTQRKLTVAALLVLLAFWLLMGWTAHYSLIDDRQWGIDIGVYWWLSGILNGRYVGNFFAVALCRFTAVKTAVMGLAMFFIPLLMAFLAVRDGKGMGSPAFLPALLLSNAALLAMPMPLWREVYGWVSGFGNYAISALFFLVWLLMLRHVEKSRRRLPLWSAALFFVTLALGLFIENLSLLVFGASLILALWALYDRPLRMPFWACLAGALAAVCLIFFNSVVVELFQAGVSLGGRRALTFSLEGGLVSAGMTMLRRYLGSLLPMAFLHGPVLALSLAVLTACAFWRGPLRPLWVLSLVPLGYGGYVWSGRPCNTLPSVFFCCLSWGLPLLAMLLQRDSLRDRVGRILLYLAAPLSLAPVAAIEIFGERFYFFPLVMVVLAAADEAAPILSRRAGLWAPGLLVIALCLVWILRGYDVLGCNLTNASLMRQALEEDSDTLVILSDRFDGTWWYPRNPVSDEGANYYARRYGLPMDMTLIVLGPGSYEAWPDITQEMWGARLEIHPDGVVTSDLPLPPG